MTRDLIKTIRQAMRRGAKIRIADRLPRMFGAAGRWDDAAPVELPGSGYAAIGSPAARGLDL